MGTISVVIPCRNDASYLAVCLQALGRQSRTPDEVVVVDDGSTDESATIARTAGARVLVQPHLGIWPATAAGFDAATGEILARLDADSIPAPDWLERVELRMGSEDRPTALTGTGTFYGGTRTRRWIARRLYLGGYFTVIGSVLGHPPLFGSNSALRRDAWAVLRTLVHRDRADVHDDLDLSWWMRPGMTVAYDPSLLVGVSVRPLGSVEQLGRRLAMAYRTLLLDWRAWPARRRRRERRHADETTGAVTS
ncbi:glycosyltransferase family 2 protein [Agromyces kandeliae]|uniref:Glycosyltransferase n=1 Tax=Agromyces kandeliae TaxID=2666141 RepID=A0A6L5R0Q2_9MICO|nr:glycosyltransferase family 2 protein [Agromyces kandeliae]MRX42657.1 glycosyltransferase [Agromyces kandeliae]